MFAAIEPPFPPPSLPREVAVVGNAPDMGDHGPAIDAADWVVRFNNAAGFGTRAGRRTTHLALVNRGGQMREWLADEGFAQRPLLAGAGSFVLPFPPDAGRAHAASPDGRDWTRHATRRLRPLGRPIRLLPHALHHAAHHALATEYGAREPNPSTGFLLAFHLHRQLRGSGARLLVYGFGFQGWQGHPWAAERAWFAARERAGDLRLVPPGS